MIPLQVVAGPAPPAALGSGAATPARGAATEPAAVVSADHTLPLAAVGAGAESAGGRSTRPGSSPAGAALAASTGAAPTHSARGSAASTSSLYALAAALCGAALFMSRRRRVG